MSYGHWMDTVTSILAGTSGVAILVTIPVVVKHRKFQAFALKQVPLIVLLALSSSMFLFASILADNHYPRYPSDADWIWPGCSLWRMWLQIVFGLGLWLCLLILRSFNLYRVWIFHQRKLPGFKGFVLELCLLWCPWLILACVSEAYDGMEYVPHKTICAASHTSWSVVVFVMLGIYVFIVCFLAMKLKRGRLEDTYLEFREILIGVAMIAVLAAGNLVVFFLKLSRNVGDDIKIFSRFFKTFTGIIAVCFFYFSTIWVGLKLLLTKGAQQGAVEFAKIRIESLRKLNPMKDPLLDGQRITISGTMESGGPDGQTSMNWDINAPGRPSSSPDDLNSDSSGDEQILLNDAKNTNQ